MPAPESLAFRLAPLVFVVFCGFMSIGLPLPALPHQVHDVLGYGPTVVGFVMGLQSLVTIMTRGLGGAICDAKGPRAAVLSGLPCAMLAGGAYLASAYATASPLLSLAVLLVGRGVLGFAESLFLTGTLTWSIARAGHANAGRAMAWQGIAMYAALGIGAPVGLALQQGPGFTAVAATVIGLPLIGFGAAFVLHDAGRGGSGTRGSFPKVLGIVWPLGMGLALGTAPFAAMAAFLPLHFAARHWGGAGAAISAFAIGYIGVRLFLAHLPDRMGGSRVAAVSLLVIVAGQLVLWLAAGEAVAIAGAALTGIGFSLVFPAFGVEVMRRTPPEMRGLAVGAFMIFFDVALGVTGPICGLAASRFGYGAVFLIGAAAAFAGLIPALAARPKAVA